jgi:glycosyltransferase involved in cell wall biosynthesis
MNNTYHRTERTTEEMGSDVSVVVPTYYRNRELSEAIESIVEQTCRPREVLVVDDSGEGHARDAVADWGEVTYVELEENRKAHPARGTGVERASGSYVQFLDDDDYLREDALEKKVPLLERDDAIGVVYNGLRLEDGPAVLPPADGRGDILELALRFRPVSCTSSTLLVERSLLEELLPFTNRYGGADDLALVIDLARRTRFDAVDEPLTIRRDSRDSWGASQAAVDGRWRILQEYDDLYEQVPSMVRNAALAETYRKMGHRRLDERLWSARSVYVFALALYYSSGIPTEIIVELVASLFGRPGRTVANRLSGWLLGRTP